MPIYNVNGRTYDIPEDKIAKFESAYPDAVVDVYDGDTGKGYEIPVSKVSGFKERFPKWSYGKPAVGEEPGLPGDREGAPEGGKGWKPTPLQKAMAIASVDPDNSGDGGIDTMMRSGIQRTVDRFARNGQEAVENLRRLAESDSPEGRRRQRAAEMQARMMGTPVDLVGLTPHNAPWDEAAEDSSSDDGKSRRRSLRGPVANGVVRGDDGKLHTRWMMPDGSLTTDILEADKAAGAAREARLEREFTGRMRDNGLDPDNPEDVDRQSINDRMDRVKAELKERNEEALSEAYSRKDGESVMNYFFRILGSNPNTQTASVNRGVSLYDDSLRDSETNDLVAEQRLLNDAATAHEASRLERGDGLFDGRNVTNFGKGVADVALDVDTYAGGTRNMHAMGRVMRLKSKLESGEKLTDGELRLAEAMMLRGRAPQDMPHGYTAGRTTAEMARFMFQMMANPTSGFGKALADRAWKRLGEKGWKAWSGRILGTVAGDVASSAFLANTLQAPATLGDASERYLGEVVVDGNGDVSFVGGDGLGKSFMKAEGAATIENYTEMLGSHLGIVGTYMGKGVGAGVRKLGGGRLVDGVTELATRIKGTDWAKGIADFERKTQWNGSVGEILEEEAGIILNSALVGDNKFSDLWDKEQQIDIALGVGVFGAFVSGIKSVGYPAMRYRARHSVETQDGIGRWRFQDDWDGIRDAINGAGDGDLSSVVTSLINEHAQSQEQAKAIAGYASALMRARGFNLAEAAMRDDSSVTREMRDAEDSFDDGYEMQETQEMRNARIEMERERGRLAGSLSEDQVAEFDTDPIGALSRIPYDDPGLREVATDYVNARMVYEGMIQRVRDDVDGRVEQSNAMIEGRVNRETGMIQPATVWDAEAKDGRRVYIVNGSVAMYDDGSGVDTPNSSESIIVRDAETGKVEFVDPARFLSVDEGIDAETEKEAARKQIVDEIAVAAANNIDGVLSFDAGETYSVLDKNGEPQEVSILGPSMDENGMPVEGSVDIQWADGQILPVATSDLQQMVEAADNRRLEQFEQEREAQRRATGAAEAAEQPATVPNQPESVPNSGETPQNPAENAVSSQVEAAQPMTPAESVPNSSPSEAAEPMTAAPVENEQQPVYDENGFIVPNPADVSIDNSVPAQPKQEQTPLERIPRDANGEPIYEQAEPDTAWDALVEQTEGDEDIARSVIEQTISEKEDELKRLSKQKPKAGLSISQKIQAEKEKKKAMDGIQQSIDHWRLMAGIRARRDAEAAAEEEARQAAEREEAERWEAEKRGMDKRLRDTADAVRHVPEAVEVLKEMDPQSMDEVAAWLLSRHKVLWSDTKRGGARMKYGVASHTGFGEGERRKLLGLFASEEKGGISLDRLSEDLFKEACDMFGVPYDNKAARDALIERIGESRTMGDIRNYIANRRIERAVRVAEQYDAFEAGQRDEHYQEAYHMSYDDYEAYEEQMIGELENIFRDFDEQEFYGIIADELANQHEYGLGSNEEAVAPGESSGDGRGVEVLPGAESGEAGGTSGNVERQGVSGEAGDALRDTTGGVHEGASEVEASQKRLNKEEATGIIAEMEQRAIVAPEMELTIENWDAQFGENGIVGTPIGNVKMGENQFTKLMRQGRNGKLGMIKPTLENPDIIIEDASEAKDADATERKSSYVFVKTFVKPDGSRYYYFTSVTVSKDGHEVVVSNQEKRRNVLTNLLMKGKLVWKHADNVSTASDVADGLYSSQGNMSDPVTEGTDAPQTNTVSSDGKGTDFALIKQASGEESLAGKSAAEAAEHGQTEASASTPMNGTTGAAVEVGTGIETVEAPRGEATIGERIAEAEAVVNTEPTDDQKEAGNYRKGHVQVGAFDVTIENPKGSVRRGTDADGKQWETTMTHTYGYIRGTEGVDGDHIDVYLHSDMDQWNGSKVFVVDQYNPDGSFDEHKVMLGFNDRDEAFSAYLSNYEDGWEKGRRLDVTGVNLDDFEKWIESSKRKTKPFAEYKSVKPLPADESVEQGQHSTVRIKLVEFAKRYGEAGSRDIPALERELTQWMSVLTAEDLVDVDVRMLIDVCNEAGLDKGKAWEFRMSIDKATPKDILPAVFELRNRWRGESGRPQFMGESEYTTGATNSDAKFSVGSDVNVDADVYYAAKGLVESTGIEVVEVSGEEARAMLEQKNTPFAGLPNRANEKQPSGSVLAAHSGGSSSNATDSRKTGAKIDNNTRSAKTKIKKFKNGDFDGDYSTLYKALSSIGSLLSMRSNGGSRYTILRTDRNDTVAIRLSDHRANGNNFGRDAADRNLSIVIERKRYDVPDSGIEFTEAVISEAVFESQPKEVVSAIVCGVEAVLADKPFTLDSSIGNVIEHHGDNTRFHIRTYHGTGAEFDRFDFRHMGSGEGVQAYGWGGYVTEVRGIGKGYATAIGGKELLPKIEKISDNIRQVRQWLSKNGDYRRYARSAAKHLRELQREYRVAEKAGDEKDMEFYRGLIELQEQSLIPENHASLISNKYAQIAEYQKELDGLNEELAQKRHLYTVRIPDDTGGNYLDWDGKIPEGIKKRIVLQATLEGVSIEFYGDSVTLAEYFSKMGEDTAGFQLYRALTRALGSDRMASELLSRAGLTGIKYAADHNNGGRADGKKNYVLFNEADMKIANHVQFMNDRSGNVYGWTVGGKVYLNRDAMNPETPIHEYTHLWDEMVRRENPELWERGKELMKQTPLWDEIVTDPNYGDIRDDDDAVASEVHARLTGKDGARILSRMIENARKSGALAVAEKVTLVEDLRDWLRKMFDALKATLGKWSKRDLDELTIEDFNRLTLRDLAEGVNPNEGELSETRFHAAMSRGREAFDALRDRAVAERGIVMPGLNETEVRVVEVPRHDFEGDKPIAQARKWAKENIVGEHTLTDSSGREVPYAISGRAIDKYLSSSAIDKSDNLGVHLSVLTKLPEVISESIEAEIHPDYNKGDDGMRRPENGYEADKLIHRFYGIVDIDGEDYRVKTTIIESRDNKVVTLPHSFEVTEIELLPKDNSSNKMEPTVSPKDSGVPHRTANLLKGVEKSYDAGVKLLETSEKASMQGAAEAAEQGQNSREDGQFGIEMDSAEELLREGDGAYSDAEVSMEGDPWSKAWGESLRTKREQREYAVRERRRMVDRVGELAERLNLGNVEIVTDASQLKGRRARAKGFFDRRTGKITIVIPNNISVMDVEQTLLHEAVAHYGLRQLLGKHFDEFLDKVYEAAENGVKERIDLLASRNGWNRRVATEEYLAGLAEDTDFEHAESRVGGWFDKIKRFFIDMLFKAGFRHLTPGSIGDNELGYILWRSYQNMANPGRYRVFEWEAEDVAMQYSLGVGEYAPRTEPVTEQSVAEAGELYELNERFNRELQQQIDGTLEAGHVYEMGMPSKELLSTGIARLPIRLSASILNIKSNLDRHAYDLSSIRNLVNAIQKPWAIFSYGDQMKAQNLIVGIEDNGRQFLVGISINPTVKGRSLEINSIRNVFPKNNHEWVNWINEGKLLRVDGKKEIQTIIAKLRMNPVAFDYVDLDNAAKIVENFENPTISEQNNNVGGDADVYFRDGEPVVIAGSIASEEYEKAVMSTLENNFDEGWHDYLRSVKALQSSIEKERGKKIEDFENIYLHALHKSSVDRQEIDKAERELITPLIDTVKSILTANKDLSLLDIERYMNCKHAPERNETIAQRKAREKEELTNRPDYKGKPMTYAEAYQIFGEKDYSGLAAIFDGNGGGKTRAELEAEAETAVSDFEAIVGKRLTDELWMRMRKVTEAALDKQYVSGLLDKDVYNELKTRWNYYVPLRGFREGTAGDVYEYVGREHLPELPADKRATGRDSEAADIIATTLSMLNRAIVSGNKNVMKQKLLNLAIKNETPLLTVSRQWYERRQDGTWSAAYPDINDSMSPADIRKAIEDFDEKMKIAEKSKNAKRGNKGLELQLREDSPRLTEEHAVKVSRNGVEYVVWVNGNPKAAQAINGLLNPDSSDSILGFVENINRKISRNITALRPNFLVRNFQRDILNATVIMSSRNGAAYTGELIRNAKNMLSPVVIKGTDKGKRESIFSLYLRYYNNRLDLTNNTDRLFDEFMRHGGETGYSLILQPKEFQKKIEKEIDGKNSVSKAITAGFHTIEEVNKCVENIVRFAAYKTSREGGKSILQSIADAKEASVNFNRKGSGAMGNRIARSIYIFVNPAVQGVCQYLQVLKSNPKAIVSWIAFHMVLGALMPIVMNLLYNLFGGGDDDDEGYFGLEPYKRRGHICIPIGGEKWLTIPMSQEQSMFYGIGEALSTHLICGKGGREQLGSALIIEISKIQPMDLIDGKMTDFNSDENLAVITARNLAPTALSYIADAFIWDEDFTGKKISRANDFNSHRPEWQKGHDDDLLLPVSRSLNDLSDFDGDGKGIINFNPSRWGYVLTKPLGGLVEVPVQVTKSIMSIWNEDYREWRNYPIVSTMVTDAGIYRNRHRMLIEEVKWWEEHKKVLDSRVKDSRKDGIFENADVIDRLFSTGELNQLEYLKMKDADYGKQPLNVIKDLNRERWDAITSKNKDKQAEVEAELVEYQKRLVEKLRSFEDMTESQRMAELRDTYK